VDSAVERGGKSGRAHISVSILSLTCDHGLWQETVVVIVLVLLIVVSIGAVDKVVRG
jgi:hypothetical protein